MIERIDPELLHPDNRFFLDYVRSGEAALRFFEQPPTAIVEAAEARRAVAYPREELVARLRAYNERLTDAQAVRANIDALADPESLCVIGGQQAGFLGGPLFAAYKILSVLRAASWLAGRLGAPVVPIFWLATEDHDFTEINRLRFLDPSGDLRTISFDWDGRGRAIERLPITEEVRAALDEALAFVPENRAPVRDVFLPDASDDYAVWHARIWSRLFADSGLVLVEPRTVRPMAGRFFAKALASAGEISAALSDCAGELQRAGFAAPLDPETAGGLFAFAEDGRRVRVDDPGAHVARAEASPEGYSPDAALRPLLADALFPTIASVLGPSEIAYQAMLNPLYRLFGIPQPILLPRHGYTLLSPRQAVLLDRCGVTVADVLADRFDPATAAQSLASPALLERFAKRKADVRRALEPLIEPLEGLDPGLPARWRQTADRIEQQIDQLEERAVRADLARIGVSSRDLRRLNTEIHPAGKPQERILSLIHVAAQHGVGWLSELESPADPDEYAHYAVTVGEPNE
jgi:bacillithiol biosynthesis cysteine-adding enzyme BshC